MKQDTSSKTICLVDDELNVLESLREGLSKNGFFVHLFSDPLKALDFVKRNSVAVVVTDILMPNMDGVDLIKRAKKISPDTSFVIITAHASIDTAIEAIRAGAVDYLIKPFRLNELVDSIRKAMSQSRFVPSSISQDEMESRYQIKNFISSDPKMIEMIRMISKVAKTNASVLITGESGTGKEMMARSIHYNSNRKKRPFVSVNCAALPENLLESELFGYEKGAFTGAFNSKQGLFEVADTGTFFLDEIGEIPPSLQAKLLRVIQERTITHLGGVKEIHVDIRLIAATSRNLSDEIKSGRFREDLYYRLNVVPIQMPPLRNRPNDIAALAQYFLKMHSEKHHSEKTFTLSEKALSVLKNHHWPGNIRELENLMERIVATEEGSVLDDQAIKKFISPTKRSDSPQPIKQVSQEFDDINLVAQVDDYEKALIQNALKNSNGNKMEAAKRLGITKQNLNYKIKKYQLCQKTEPK